MDAKPQRPPPRAIRIHDENMPFQATQGQTGKTLHQRTMSMSIIGPDSKKKALGEADSNARVAPKDDSEIGKASPGKLKLLQEQQPPLPLARAALRPLSQKYSNMQTAAANTKAAVAQAIRTQPVLVPKTKKSTKVLKDSQPDTQPVTGAQQYPLAQSNEVTAEGMANGYVPTQPQDFVTTQYNSPHAVPIAPQVAPITSASTATAVQAPVNGTQAVQASIAIPHAGFPAQAPVVNTNAAAAVQIPQHPYQEPQLYVPPSQAAALPMPAPANSQPVHQPYFHDDTTVIVYNPAQTKRSIIEIAEAKAFVESARTPDDIEDEQWDTSMVAEYGDDIFEYMREMESRMSPNASYMELQQEIQWSMRSVLMDWVVQVHQRFNLLPETLFLTVNYIDRFLSCKIVSLGKLQLVGATAIFVAAKYEEVNCPTISEIIYMVDNGYTADELLKAERFMLSMLQFELGWPGPMSFLRRISKADDYDLETRTLAKYFLEVTIMDERFVGCKPSFLAAGAHCLARLMLRKGEWTQAHVYYSNYTFVQLHHLLVTMCNSCADPQKHHSAVFDKYSDKRYKKASVFVSTEMNRGFQLPFDHQPGHWTK